MAGKTMRVQYRDDLLSLLSKHEIPWSSHWKKHPMNLLEEIQKRESFLEVGDDGKLRRVCRVVRIIVRYENQYLVEIFRVVNGKKVTRLTDLGASVNEKLIGEEHPIACAKRALQEELGVNVFVSRFFPLGSSEEEKDSLSYGGLPTLYRYRTFGIELDIMEYQPVYIEESDGRKTYFGWLPMSLANELWE